MASYSDGGRAGVSMDYDVVQAMADGFQAAADQLHIVNRALEIAISFLNATAFTGIVGNRLLADYLENIQPHVVRLAATCAELHDDLVSAIVSLRDGDYSGSMRFLDGGSRRGIDGGLYSPGGDPYRGSPDSVDVVFINGIMNDFDAFNGSVAEINNRWGERNVAGIYNQTEGLLPDVGQGFQNRFQAAGWRVGEHDAAVERLKDLIRKNAAGDRTLELVGHSQGGAIISAALEDLYREDPNLVNFVEVTTFGSFGFDYPPGPTYHHYVFAGDPIPSFAQSLDSGWSPSNALRYYSNLTVLHDNNLNPFDDHFMHRYFENLDRFRQEEARLQSGNFASQAAKRAFEFVESQALRPVTEMLTPFIDVL